ncbi:DnaJ subfamily B member 2 [Tetrabaena socialis]|uniref:DnaJ subfamily B member 2 n=1 Tax=Tetrabaena socialis TaxID=47790 RepID=A0A2J7ZMI0_9CHLO|nr:DnaJ subfamily B member 2 [Tetrabaena socialis]|eukprot:PNH01467.1 DnaJ subfamily B member 2 [Tetrabaena socialis]
MANPDPYQVLRLPRDFTLAELKTNYKRLALQLHPDKNIVSREHAAEVFQILTHCYKELLSEHNQKQDDKQFMELRTASRGPERAPEERERPNPLFSAGDGRFDTSIFNKFFTDNKLSDPVLEAGYGDWLKHEAPTKAAPKSKNTLPKECKSLLLHVDAMPLGRSRLSYSEMGVAAVDDFSLVPPSCKQVGATDLRVAYSLKGDDEEGPAAGSQRREYKNIGELKMDRAGIAFHMNDADASAHDSYKEWQSKQESAQQGVLRQSDERIQAHFGRLQSLIQAAPTK